MKSYVVASAVVLAVWVVALLSWIAVESVRTQLGCRPNEAIVCGCGGSS